jgi:hypothetical protein
MKKYISMIVVFLAASISGCKKDYLSQEVNPNNPSVTTPQLTLAAALVGAATIVATDYTEYGVWGGYWTTSGNYVPNSNINQYQFTNQSFDSQTGGPWIDLYSNLTNFNTLQTLSSASKANANFQAIAMIMKAYDFEQLVDSYNDVPYSQAFQPSTILFPQYDKAQVIYDDLGKQLQAAIALIKANPTATNPGSADVAFGGNMTGWTKFANSILLRLAVHVSTNFPSDALIAAAKANATDGYLDGTIQAAVNPGYNKGLASSGASQQNPFWDFFGLDINNNAPFNAVYWRANDFSVKFMQNNNDPRVSQIYAPMTGTAPAVVIHGNVFGDTSPANQPNPGTSGIGPGLLQSPSQDAVLFSGAESLFLQAEAALKGIITANPQTLYEAGITASFVELGAGGTYVPSAVAFTPQTPQFIYTRASAATSAALAVTYYSQANANVSYTASPDKLQAIIIQKWVALNGYFNLEGYNEYRRTGFPVLPSSIDPAAIKSTLPSRIYYPISEQTSNATSLAKEGTIDPWTSKIFWAK